MAWCGVIVVMVIVRKLCLFSPFQTIAAGQVSFAWNYMGDEAVGRLLQAEEPGNITLVSFLVCRVQSKCRRRALAPELWEALQRSELRVSALNFSGNCLGPAGTSHVCDFVQARIEF